MNKSNFLEQLIGSDSPGNYVIVNGITERDLEIAIAKFNRKVYNSGLMEELKKRSYYEKPSAKRHRTHKNK